MTGVRAGEIARFVPYELGFVVLPGWLTYRALVPRPPGRLSELVFGWSLGYLLEILAFYVTAAGGFRSVFYVYPILVGGPAALVARRRSRTLRASERDRTAGRRLSVRPVWIGALLCTLLLGYAAAVGFTQTPLPRDISSATYQEDTVFVISLAAEALHHVPMTLPMVSGEPLHYHVFAFMHMAAISQVTGIDLSVVVLRLYEVPLLLLFALQLILAGRRVGRSGAAGLAALFVVVFLGELDAATATETSRFLFRDLFFYWLLASHTFLLGLVFFLPATVLLCDLLGAGAALRRTRWAEWVLLAAFLLGCVGSKSYSLLEVGGAVALFLLWRLWRERAVSRPALLALGVSVTVYLGANVLVFGWNSAGALLRPLKTVEQMAGVVELGPYFRHVWGTGRVPDLFGVPYGTYGLLGISILGIALLLGYRKLTLSPAEGLFLCFFAAALPTFFFSSQPGFGQLFLVFFGVVPGTILAASGYTLFWTQHARSLRVAVPTLVGVVALVVLSNALLGADPRVGVQVTLFLLVVAAGLGAIVGAFSRRLALPFAVVAGSVGVLLLDTPIIRLLRSALGGAPGLSVEDSLPPILLALGALALGSAYVVRRRSPPPGFAAALVSGTLLLGVLNTPLDWFPKLTQRALEGKPLYNQSYSGLTAGLYEGLLWIRHHTNPDAVLVVNNHSLYRDGHDSKYFYYSAFAQRRVFLESWDYTEQTVSRGFFSLDKAHSPFPGRLALSDAVFYSGDETAVRRLARNYGVRYLVVDKVHGGASPEFLRLLPAVFTNNDVDVYAAGKPGRWLCHSELGAGFAAVFGHRRTPADAERLRRAAESVGFPGLVIQRRGCFNYVVALTGLLNLAEAKDFQKQAATVDFRVKLECRTDAPQGGLNAVFGHRRTKRAAERLATEVDALGFHGLEVRQDTCGDWEVDRAGLRTAAERRGYRLDVESVDLRITFEPG